MRGRQNCRMVSAPASRFQPSSSLLSFQTAAILDYSWSHCSPQLLGAGPTPWVGATWATRPGERGSLPQTQCHPGCSLNHRLSVCSMTDFPACPSACAHTLPDSHRRIGLYRLRSCRAVLSHCAINISLSCHHVYWLLHWLRACMLSPVCLASGYLSEPVNEILLLWMWLAELVVASVSPPRMWKGWFSYI